VPIEDILSGKVQTPSLTSPQSDATYSGVGEASGISSRGKEKEKEKESGRDAGSSERASGASASPPSSPSKKTPGVSPPVAPASPEPRRHSPSRSSSLPKAEDLSVPRFVGLTPLEIEPEPLDVPDPGGAYRAEVEKRHGTLGAVLEDTSIRVEGKSVRIVLDPPSPEIERRLAEPAVRKVLEEAAVALLGRRADVFVEGVMPPAGDLTAAAAAADPAALERENLRKRAAQDEKMRKVIDLFAGEIVDVKRDERHDG
jgi:hypothetical protein